MAPHSETSSQVMTASPPLSSPVLQTKSLSSLPLKSQSAAHGLSMSNGLSTTMPATMNGHLNGHTNGVSQELDRPALKPGIYVPTTAFFVPGTEDLDLPIIASHALRLARSGVTGITTQGSNGEAVHLTQSERSLITSTTRRALDKAGYARMPLIVGCGAQSTRESIGLCHDAAEAGGSHVLVLPPSYYKAACGKQDLLNFFRDIADASPLPVLLYNYPGAAAGIDLSSDDIISLAKHPNIVGCKLTCGNTGKLCRVAAETTDTAFIREHKRSIPFLTFGGSADFLLQTLIAGGHGSITGLGNIVPKAVVKLYNLYVGGTVAEARELQKVVARADWAVIEGGVVGTKAALEACFGYGGMARKPLPSIDDDEVARWGSRLKECVELEEKL